MDGGLEDQPYYWKRQLDTVLEAKEWSEALHQAEQQVKEISRSVENSDDPDEDMLESLDKVGAHYERVTEDHKQFIKDIRSWWRDGEEFLTDTEKQEREQKREDEEFLRMVARMERRQGE